MGVVEKVFESLKEIPESSVIALEANSDAYFDVIRAITEKIPTYKNLDVIYINSTLPANSIINVMDLLDIKRDNIYFVDCGSSVLLTQQTKNGHVLFVESPTMLENIMLKVEFLFRKLDKKKGKLVFLDSINSLAIHNSLSILSEFMHILFNNMRSKGAYTVVLSIKEQSSEDISRALTMVCDEKIDVKEEW